MTNRVSKVVVALLVVGSLGVVARRAMFDATPWLAEYREVRTHLTATYANLQWNADRRGLDLQALDAKTVASIEAAGTDVEAAMALEAFLKAFDDGHVRFDHNPPPLWALIHILPYADGVDGDPPAADEEAAKEQAPPWPAGFSAEQACAEGGFDADAPKEDPLGVAQKAGWRANPSSQHLHGGTLNGGRVGYLRIPSFDQYRYVDACRAVWKPGEACDEDCQRDFRWRRVPQAIVDEVAKQLGEMASVETLVVDVTGNGGGTNWEDPIARMLTSARLACPRVSGIRHDHWKDRAKDALTDVESALSQAKSVEARALLEDARVRLVAWDAELAGRCDLSPLWSGGDPGCSVLTRTPITTCGAIDYAAPGTFDGIDNVAEFWGPAQWRYREGIYRGRLIVAVDGSTASSAEYFAGILQDHGAEVVGQQTNGSGCGHTWGGLPLFLPHSGQTLWAPDCTRWRKDGTNEVAGITPDRLVDLANADVLALASNP